MRTPFYTSLICSCKNQSPVSNLKPNAWQLLSWILTLFSWKLFAELTECFGQFSKIKKKEVCSCWLGNSSVVVLVLANLTPESRNICLLMLCLNAFGSVIFVSTAVKFSVVLWCFVVAGFGMYRSQDCGIYPQAGSSSSLFVSKVSF